MDKKRKFPELLFSLLLVLGMLNINTEARETKLTKDRILPETLFSDSFESKKQQCSTKYAVAQIDEKIKYSGEKSLRVDLNATRKISNSCIYAWVWKLKKNSHYALSFYYRNQGVKRKTVFEVSLILKNKDDSSVNANTFKVHSIADNKWKKAVYEFQTSDKELRVAQLVFNQFAASGTVWLDDIKITKINDEVTIKPAVTPPVIDGCLDDRCWQTAVPLDIFYDISTDQQPAKTQTRAFLTYDKSNIYIAFENLEPEMNKLKVVGTSQNDQPLWKGDCDEVFIKAPGLFLQFMGNAAGRRFDSRLYQAAAGDPFRADPKWNGQWRVKGSRGKDRWFTEFAIPLKNFRTRSPQGQTWKINLAREKTGIFPECSNWNRAGKSFTNPVNYASIKFGAYSAELKRFSEEKTKYSFIPERKNQLFKSLQTAGGKTYPSYYQPQGAGSNTLEARLKDAGECGFTAYILPWLPKGGVTRLVELLKKYKTGVYLWLHSSDRGREAKRLGSHFPSDPTTPEYTQGVINFLNSFVVSQKKLLPYLKLIYGKDEPTNQITDTYSLSLHPELKTELEKVSDNIKKSIGFGKFGLYDAYGADTQERPFLRITFYRWLNARILCSYTKQYKAVKKLFPEVPYIGLNLNNCADMSPVNATIGGEVGSRLGIDAYPGSTCWNVGMERAVYHVGFTVKYTKDLAPKTELVAILQAFIYGELAPTPAMLREWTAQAMKNGAASIFWWASDNGYTRIPDTYKEAMRISNLLRHTRRVKVPVNTYSAIFLSYPTMWGLEDKYGHAQYSLYAILGERLKSWFRFVSESVMERGYDQLRNYRLLYIPRLTYTDAVTADKIIDFVKEGGTLVVFDPEIFSWNINGERLSQKRLELLGGKLLNRRRHDKKIKLENAGFGLGRNSELPLGKELNIPAHEGVCSYNVSVPKDAKVIAVYADNKPAAYERQLGKGKVIYFAAQPFGNSGIGIRPENWEKFFRFMADSVGEKMNLPIWDLTIPATGYEVPVNK